MPNVATPDKTHRVLGEQTPDAHAAMLAASYLLQIAAATAIVQPLSVVMSITSGWRSRGYLQRTCAPLCDPQ